MSSGGGGAGSAGTATGGSGSGGTPATTGGTPSAGSAGTATGGGGSGGGGGGAASGGGGAAGAAGGGAGGGGAGGTGGAGGDTCPDDPDKMTPGKCGCGVPDVDGINGAGCGPLQDAITHRYSFEGNAMDSVGSSHGTLMGGATITSGALTLAGGTSGQYLDLPNGIISSLTDATFEAFVTWSGTAGGDWQRVFDFGSSDTDGKGSKYIFLSARTFRTAYTSATPPKEVIANSNTPFPTTTAQVAVVVNATGKKLEIYLEGNQVATTTLDQPLSAIDDSNNWLGRSQFTNDEYFTGKISEFRIYKAALTGPQLKTSKKMGENTTYLKK